MTLFLNLSTGIVRDLWPVGVSGHLGVKPQ